MTMHMGTCPTCHGRGQLYIHGCFTCPKCGGTGQIMVQDSYGGNVSGGGGYKLEKISETILNAIPRIAYWVLAILGALFFLGIGSNERKETGFLVFITLIGGAVGFTLPKLLVFVLDLAIKLVKFAVVLIIVGAILAVIHYASIYFLE